jgi:hypothetical protein
LKATDGRTVSGFVESGSGKIGYQLLQETYQVGLQGKAEAYAAFWVPLLEKCARTIKDDHQVRFTSPFPIYENQPIDFDVISSGNTPQFKVDNTALPLSEDLRIDDLWHGRVWLEGTQWHSFSADSTIKFVHIAKEGTWRSLANNNNTKATSLVATSSVTDGTAFVSYDDRAVKVILFSLLVIAAGFLWLSPKL